MDKVRQKISYIEGLMEGIELKSSSKEGKVIHEILEVCKMLTKHLDQMKLQVEDQEAYIEAIDEDLADIEEILFEDDLEEIDEIDELEVDQAKYDVGYYELECPHCEEMILVDHDIFERDVDIEVTCPECKNIIEVNDEEPIISRHLMNMENNRGEIHYYSP